MSQRGLGKAEWSRMSGVTFVRGCGLQTRETEVLLPSVSLGRMEICPFCAAMYPQEGFGTVAQASIHKSRGVGARDVDRSPARPRWTG